MTKNEALRRISREIGETFTISNLKDEKDVYLFLAESKDPDAIPSKLVCGVNKRDGRTGYSVYSVEDVVEECTEE